MNECLLIVTIVGSAFILASIFYLGGSDCCRQKMLTQKDKIQERFSCNYNIDTTQRYFHHGSQKVNCLSTRCRAEGLGQTKACPQILEAHPKWGTLPLQPPPCAEGSSDWSCDTAMAHAAYLERRKQQEDTMRDALSAEATPSPDVTLPPTATEAPTTRRFRRRAALGGKMRATSSRMLTFFPPQPSGFGPMM